MSDKEMPFGGKLGFGHLNYRPDGTQTKKLEAKLKTLMLDINPIKTHPAEFVYNYQKVLNQTKEGHEILILAMNAIHINHLLFQALQAAYNPDNLEAIELRNSINASEEVENDQDS